MLEYYLFLFFVLVFDTLDIGTLTLLEVFFIESPISSDLGFGDIA